MSLGIVLLCACASSALAADLLVPNSYATIEDALAVATADDTIKVKSSHSEIPADANVDVTVDVDIISYNDDFSAKEAGATIYGKLQMFNTSSRTVEGLVIDNSKTGSSVTPHSAVQTKSSDVGADLNFIDCTLKSADDAGARACFFDPNPGANTPLTVNFTGCSFVARIVIFNNCPQRVYNFTNCTVDEITELGVYIGGDGDGSEVNMDNVVVDNHTGVGAWVNCDTDTVDVTMTDVTVNGIYGTTPNAIRVRADSSIVMERCAFTGLSAGAFNFMPGSTASLNNCYFDGGGTVGQAWGDIAMTHCTFVNLDAGTCFVCPDATSSSSVKNSIFYAPGGTANTIPAEVDADYNLIVGSGTAGPNGLDNVIPGFVLIGDNTASPVVLGDYHLQTTSWAIGGGADLGVLVDLEGSTRPMAAGTAPDIGAYEEQVTVPTAIDSWELY